MRKLTDLLINQLINKTNNQSTNQSVNKTNNQSISRPIKQHPDQSTNPSINPSVHKQRLTPPALTSTSKTCSQCTVPYLQIENKTHPSYHTVYIYRNYTNNRTLGPKPAPRDNILYVHISPDLEHSFATGGVLAMK